jgi:hypothetical protein
MMGEAGIEIWYDAGSSGLETTPGISFFPYRRRSGGVLPYSIATPNAIAVGDGSVFWVSQHHLVLRTSGYQAQRISTHAIEAVIEDLGPFNVVSAFWPTRTLVYDCATKAWHDRSSGGGRWLPNATAHPGPDLLFGDYLSGRLFRSQATSTITGLDDVVPIERQIVFPPIWAGTGRAFCSRFEIELESGDPRLTDGTVTLDWSDDGGFTWTGGPRAMTARLVEFNRRQRVFTTRLGSFRQRVFRLTMRGAVTVYAADADITGGAS